MNTAGLLARWRIIRPPGARSAPLPRSPQNDIRALIADDTGSTTAVSAGIIAAIGAVVLIILSLTSTVVHSHHAHVAADAAALAGAHALVLGGSPCQAARDLAEANGGHLATCDTDGADVIVGVLVAGKEATARAGPIG